MELHIAVVLGAVLFAIVIAFFIRALKHLSTATETDSSDDETSGQLSVNVVADHDEQDSLLPKFAGLLRSPWHSVNADQKEQLKVMRPVRKGSRSMSLTIPLPLRKKKILAEVPVKKVHVPYFFPLLEETAEWWQSQHFTVSVAQPTSEQEPEADPESRPGLGSLSSSNNQTKTKIASSQDLVQDRLQFKNAADKLAAVPIEVGGS
ncbi:hypothetical protein V7S43_002637 [Phytophthora oleae]|uniref:Uncharacterized protein n=1 Tax=Phytophthora oleae TaxID=2107226 RepID=A0ABD3FYH8_9STRA